MIIEEEQVKLLRDAKHYKSTSFDVLYFKLSCQQTMSLKLPTHVHSSGTDWGGFEFVINMSLQLPWTVECHSL